MLKHSLKLSTIVLLLAVAGTTFAQSGDAKADAKKAAQMEAMMKAISPGEQHAMLKKMVGTWSVVSKWWENPKAQPVESKGTSTYEMVLGDRYIKQTYKGEAMGQPFEGIGHIGYNNLKKKFESSWMDSMSTQLFYSEGTISKDGKTITFLSEAIDPMTGKKKKTYDEMIMESDTKQIWRMHDGNSAKAPVMLELTYTKN
jgi:hypothetical protein